MKRIEAELHESHLFEAVNRVVKKHLASEESAYQGAAIALFGMLLMEVIEEFGTLVSQEGIEKPLGENRHGH